MIRAVAKLLFFFAVFVAGPVYANWCATPGRAGSASLSGVVNTYYPGTAAVAAGATSIPIGSGTGAAGSIVAGDLLLVIQMQDGTFDRSNDDGYGDNVGGGFANGYTAIQQAGRYEFVRATGAVSGGSVPVVSATGGGLVYAYRYTASSDTNARESFQVIEVPQYADATVAGTVSAMAWNGSTGGVIAVDVARRLTFSGGTISASGLGFRGGGGRGSMTGSGANTDYRVAASNGANGSKGEGIVGTPRYVNNGGSLLDTGVEGYRDGSFARGAPGNAGGGGTDGTPVDNQQNTGGGGGGNGGAGGRGGHAWCPATPVGCAQTGGHPGAAIAEIGVDRIVMGGGGGAATTNNSTGTPGLGFASSGAAGGGIVIVRAGEVAGSGTLAADGADGNSTVTNDGTGGGGAGGSILFSTLRTIAGASVSASAAGGDGGTNTGGGAAHGPGGGGGGGFIASTIAISTNVFGGNNGTTQNGGTYGSAYGATGGSGGNGISITGANIPGASSGGECTPTIVKSFAASAAAPGVANRLSIAVTNNNPTLSLAALAFTDTYPAGITNTATPAASKTCATAATLTAAALGSAFSVSAATINAASTCTYSVNTLGTTPGSKTNTIPAGALTATHSGIAVASLADASATVTVSAPLTIVKSSIVYSDPLNGLTTPKAIPGGFVSYTVLVSNPATLAVDSNSIIVVDATPANLQLYVGNIPGGTGPILFVNGAPSSALTYAFTSLASTTDDVEFSNNSGSTWTYVPVPNANGVDPAVTHMRIKPKGSMAAGSSFSLFFGYRII
ncbi:MAG TPA: hypothetical protein VK472_03675 [Allosphingosinicella sp.]|nr:hypothetical protein [Allosphingosinicella sp.]